MKKYLFPLMLILLVVILAGCGFFGGDKNSKPEITIDLSTNYFSKYSTYSFEGECDKVNYVTLNIGGKSYDAVVTPGHWSVENVDMAEIGIGKDIDLVVYGYKYKGSAAPDTQTETYKITIHSYKDSSDTNNPYEYTFIDDFDYSSYNAKLTDIAESDDYIYVSGYYRDNYNNIAPFVYRVDPILGTWDKKKVWNWISNADENPVSIAIGGGKVYIAYTIPNGDANIKVLDSDLNEESYSYNDTSGAYQIFRSMCYKDGYLYLTGDYYSDPIYTLVFKIHDDGTSLGEQSDYHYSGSSQESHGYDIAVGNDGKIYVAAEHRNGGIWYAAVYGFNNDLSPYDDTNYISSEELYGIDYSPLENLLYATGVSYYSAPDWETIFWDKINASNLSLPWDTYSFQQSSGSSDESGYGLIHDDDNGYTVIVGYSNATASDLTDAKASICVRNGGNEVKTVKFVETGYQKSALRRVVKCGHNYYAVGYALDDYNTNKPLLIFTPVP